MLCTPHSVSPTVAEGILCAGRERGNLVRCGVDQGNRYRPGRAGCYRISS